MTLIRIPTPLRPYTEGLREIDVDGKTVGIIIQEVASKYPSIQPHLFDNEGNLRAYVNIFLNEHDIRNLSGHDTQVEENDKLMIVPSIAGGSGESETLPFVDHAALRTNQASIITLLLVAFVVDSPLISSVVASIMLLGTLIKKPGFLPIYRALRWIGVVKPDRLRDYSEPHQFAQGFGSLVVFLAMGAFFTDLPVLGWTLVGLVIFLAGLNLFLGFCVGCAVYYWFNRLGLPFFQRVAPLDRTPGSRPPREKAI
jgi:molybdopterin converting factor small subunit